MSTSPPTSPQYDDLSLSLFEDLDEECQDVNGYIQQSDSRLLQNGSKDLVKFPPEILDIHNNSQHIENLKLKPNEMAGRMEVADYNRHSDEDDLRKKLHSSQIELENYQSQLCHLQSENARLRSQLEDQSAFCASLGAVLGNLVWKASRVPPVVDILLSGNKLGDFLCIVSGTLDSFLETFHAVMPGPTADESQFIMAMGGIVTNMAAAPAGRQYLVSDPNGRELIQHIVRVIPAIPTPSGNCLKRLLVMALYNVSINQSGLCLLHEEKGEAVFSVVGNCLEAQSSNELRLMALRLLLSLTCDLNDASVLNAVYKHIPKDLIKLMVQHNDANVQAIAQEVLENLNRAHERIDRGSSKAASGSFSTEGTTAFSCLPQYTGRTAWKLPKTDTQSN